MLLRRLRGGPWLWAATHLVKLGRRRWAALPDADRRELLRIVRKSRGRTGKLTADEQREGKRIVRVFLGRGS